MASKPKFKYNTNSMENAIKAVREKNMNVYRASLEFNVPRSSLQNLLDGKADINVRKFGPKPVLDQYEELLVKWIEVMSEKGFPIVSSDLLSSVEKIVKEMKLDTKFPNGKPGKKWLKLFMNRHPSIAKRTVEKVTKSRACVTKQQILNWFSNIESFLIDSNLRDILEDPSRIFNTDESGFMMCPKGEKVLSIRGQKNVYEVIGNNEKQQITVLVNVSADGIVAPTMVVFAGKRLPKGIAQTMPEDWAMAKSDKGWITGETFFEYVLNVFYPWLVEKNIKLPVILFLDGHVSHLTYHLSVFCESKGIHIIAFYPNATHIQQPLDVAMFGPLKQEWAKEVHKWRMQTQEPLNKMQFSPMLNTVIKTRLTEATIKSGFATCGLYPWNPQAIDYSKCLTTSCDPEPSNPDPDNIPLPTSVELNNNQLGHNYLEIIINKQTLQQFKEELNNDVWTGPTEAKDLFEVWRTSYLLSSGTTVEEDQCVMIDNLTPETFDYIPTLNKQILEPNVETIVESVDLSNIPSCSTAFPKDPTSEEKRRNKLAEKISPHTGGKGVPSPFKKNLLWPKTPEKRNKVNRRLRMPSVVTSKKFQEFEEKKLKEKQIQEQLKAERKRKREDKKNDCKAKRVTKKRGIAEDEDEDWQCAVCLCRYNSEVIRGIVRQWVECDGCKKQFHVECIPKEHRKDFDLDVDDEEEIEFVCHLCVPNDDELSGIEDFDDFSENSDDEA